MIKKPLLIKGDIVHKRFFPKENSFHYKSTYISFALSQISALKNSLFSVDKFNLFSFHHKNYGEGGGDAKKWISKIFQENGINDLQDIILITHPKVLGYVFNPVSFWLAINKENELVAVLSEVNNTCGQRHCYLCFNEDLSAIDSKEWIEAKKEFYVSPFMEIEGKYRFRFEYKLNQMNFFINYLVDDKLKLTTYLKCNFEEFSAKNLLLSFLKIPFATFKTIILIHYQALKLYLKSISFYKCPDKLENNLTIGKNAK